MPPQDHAPAALAAPARDVHSRVSDVTEAQRQNEDRTRGEASRICQHRSRTGVAAAPWNPGAKQTAQPAVTQTQTPEIRSTRLHVCLQNVEGSTRHNREGREGLPQQQPPAPIPETHSNNRQISQRTRLATTHAQCAAVIAKLRGWAGTSQSADNDPLARDSAERNDRKAQRPTRLLSRTAVRTSDASSHAPLSSSQSTSRRSGAGDATLFVRLLVSCHTQKAYSSPSFEGWHREMKR